MIENDKNIDELFLEINKENLLKEKGNSLYKEYLKAVSDKDYTSELIKEVDSKIDNILGQLYIDKSIINNEMVSPKINQEDKTITIVISCYRKFNIVDTVKSCINQSRPPELILVSLLDSHSVSLKDELESLSPIVECFIVDRKGISSDRNFLVDKVKTTHTLNLDAGDCLEPDFIDKDLAQEADVVTHSYLNNGNKIQLKNVFKFQPTITINTEFFKELGKWNEDFNIGGEEFDLYLRLLKKGKIINIPGGVIFDGLSKGMRDVSINNKFYWKAFSKDYKLHINTLIPELKEMWESIKSY